jgi:predicted GNAT family acetyltransferase
LASIRSSGRTVVPTCWYVAQFIDGHPDYADLLAS